MSGGSGVMAVMVTRIEIDLIYTFCPEAGVRDAPVSLHGFPSSHAFRHNQHAFDALDGNPLQASDTASARCS